MIARTRKQTLEELQESKHRWHHHSWEKHCNYRVDFQMPRLVLTDHFYFSTPLSRLVPLEFCNTWTSCRRQDHQRSKRSRSKGRRRGECLLSQKKVEGRLRCPKQQERRWECCGRCSSTSSWQSRSPSCCSQGPAPRPRYEPGRRTWMPPWSRGTW